MGLNVYLNFNGNCKEAAELYSEIFHTEKPKFMLFGDVPAGDGHPPLSEEDKKLVMHTEVRLDGTSILMSDVPSFMPFVQGNNISLVLPLTDLDEIQRVFDQLKVGGVVTMELQETFWSKRYGFLIDKFGIGWQISYATPQS